MVHVLKMSDLIYFQFPSAGAIFSIILSCILLLVSGFVSGSEIAFFSLTPSDLDELDEEHSSTDKQIAELRQDSERTLATILIVNNLVNVTIIMLLNYALAQMIQYASGSFILQILINTVVLTFLLLLFGEIMPKIYSRQHSLKFCRQAAGGIKLLQKLFYYPASWLMKSSSVAASIVGNHSHVLSVDELEQALELTDTEDIKDEKSMLEGIIRFGDETAKDVMTSRQDIVSIDITAHFDEVLRCILENNYSRIPVYQHSSDHICGFLYIKDLLPHLNRPASFRWQTLVRPPHFVPETKKIDDILREFQDSKVHMAIVVDEYGGTSGLITLEDILEEIVGEINDEYDEDSKTYTKVNNNTFIFEGKTLLADVVKVLDIDDDEFEDIEGEAETIAGLLLELKGDFPTLHEKFEYKNYSFEILALDGRRISKVKLIVHKQLSQQS